MTAILSAIWRHPQARLGLVTLCLILLFAIIGPWCVVDPEAYVGTPHEPPNFAHWFGTTGQGQDVFAQTVVGAGPTLFVGFSVGILVTLIGGMIGITSGLMGGWTDEFATLIINVSLVIPGLPLAIILAAYLPPGPLSLTVVLTLTGWAWTARVIRAQTLSLCQRDFIAAARVAGEPIWRIVIFELTPHMASLLLSSLIGTTIYAIGAQVGLEFLGLGDVSAVTWGTNLYWASNDQALLTRAWWTFVPTGLGVALVGFALAMINFGLDEISNPRLSVERRWRRALQARGVEPSSITPKVNP